MPVAELKRLLKLRGLPTVGKQPKLVEALEKAIDEEEEGKKEALTVANQERRRRTRQSLEYLIYRHGSKLAHALHNLRGLWAEEPDAKVIIFSKVRPLPSLPLTVLVPVVVRQHGRLTCGRWREKRNSTRVWLYIFIGVADTIETSIRGTKR